MSSFICSAKHFNSIENALQNLPKDFYWPYALRKIAVSDLKKTFTKHVNTLRELNVLCVCLQYAHHYKGTLDTEIQVQKMVVKAGNDFEKLSLPQLYQALKCVNYQIEIEHLTRLRELTPLESAALEFCNMASLEIAKYLVEHSEEYKSAKWCID